MEWYVTTSLVLGSFLGLMLIGVPVVFAFLATNIVFLYLLMGGEAGLQQLILSIYDSLTLFVILPVTLFVLMGEVMFRSGMGERMVDALDRWIGKLPGRLGLLTVFSGAVSAALSGASIGTTAMLGSTMAPQMEKRGYDRRLTLGTIMASGGLAIMIPPTTLGVILAVLAQVSVGNFIIAIILPGLLLASIYAGYVIIRSALQPKLAPVYDVEAVSLGEKIRLTVRYILPLGIVIFLVTVSIFIGVATPTEAAALGTAGTCLLALAYGRMTKKVLVDSLRETLRTSVMVLTILAASQAFSQILAFSGANRHLPELAASLALAPMVQVAAMLVVITILGCFLNGVPLMMVTVPVFMPIVKVLGLDPIWFCVLILITVEMAQRTPPFGILLFVMKGVGPPGTTLSQCIAGAMPFLICDVFAIAAIMSFPALALWLPSLMQ